MGDPEKRRHVVEWSFVGSHATAVILASDAKEARRVFREKTRRMGYGVSVDRITVHPEDRRPGLTQGKGSA